MKTNNILIGIVVILLMLWVGSEILKASGQTVTEGFQSPQITLNFCPTWAPQVQTVKGNTDCCEGELVDGKCSHKTFCTLSPSHDGIPNCIDAWRNYFVEKSKQCPTNMPNYFENVKVKGSTKGCSASPTTQDGANPSNNSMPKCVVYSTEAANRVNKDSCFVEKERQKIRCPVLTYPGGYTSRVELNTYRDGPVEKFGSFVCVYTNNSGQRTTCSDEKSLMRMWTDRDPNWRQNRSKYSELVNVGCKGFTERERIKEDERVRAEELRRKLEEERRRREQMASRFRSLWDRLKNQANQARWQVQNQFDSFRRRAEEERRRQEAAMAQMRDRLKKC